MMLSELVIPDLEVGQMLSFHPIWTKITPFKLTFVSNYFSTYRPLTPKNIQYLETIRFGRKERRSTVVLKGETSYRIV